MTVTSAEYMTIASGSGTTGPFPYPHTVTATGDITVVKYSSTGVPTTLAYPADYSVSGLGTNSLSVTTTAAIAVGQKLVIYATPVLDQALDIRNESGFHPDTLEDALDRNTIAAKSLQLLVDRTITTPLTEAPGAMTLPDAATRANKQLIFDAAGNATAGASVVTGTVSVVMQPVVTAATLAAGRSALLSGSVMDPVVNAASLANARSAMGPWGDALVTPTGGTVASSAATHASKEVWVEDFGAVGNGSTDDTAAIQAAINTGKTVRFKPVTYLINAVTKLNLTSGSCLIMSPETVLQAASHGTSNAFLLWLNAVSNVVIRGGTIKGVRASTGIGVGIYLAGCTNVHVDGVRCENWRTDGLIMSSDASNNPCDRCTVVDSIFKNNYRNGASVTAAKNWMFDGCIFQDTNGSSPETGLDVEPDSGFYAHTGRINNCIAFGNYGDGFKIQEGMGGGSYTRDVVVTGCVARGNIVNGFTINAIDRIALSGLVSYGNTQDGVSISAGTSRLSASGITCDTNGRTGLIAAGMDDSSLTGISCCGNNSGYGVAIGTCSNITLQATCRSNGIHGVYVDTCTNTNVSAACTSNGADGLRIKDGTGVVINGVFRSNTQYGVVTSGALDRYIIAGVIAQANTTSQIADNATGVNKSVTGNITA